MPEPDHSRIRHATVEDCVDESDAAFLDSRHNVHVPSRSPDHTVVSERRHARPLREGRDSRYGSQSVTVPAEPLPTNPKPTAFPIERERQPYHHTKQPSSMQPARQQTSVRAKDTISEPQPERPHPKAEWAHPRGICRLCDHFGCHDESKADKLPPLQMQPHSPKASRKTAVRDLAEPESSAVRRTRRSSSAQRALPLTLNTSFATPPPHQPYYSPTPVLPHPGWQTPVLPPLSYGPPPYPFASPDPASATIQYSAYQPAGPFYEPFPQIPQETRSAQPSRRPSPHKRSSVYGQPLIRYPSHEVESNYYEGPAREYMANAPSHRPRQTFDVDRQAMPPPAKTQSISTPFAQKPRNTRAQTYHSEDSLPRQRSSRAREQYEEDDDYRQMRAPTSHRGRRESPSRPPTSYKPPSNLESRPVLPKKAVSYSTPETVSRVASSQKLAQRSNTLPSISLEQQEANVEAYQRNKKRESANLGLSYEALKSLSKGTSSSRSETASSYSHKSHQSSKDSSRGLSHASTSATQFTISGGGLSLSIPANYGADGQPSLTFSYGDAVVNIGGPGREPEKVREQKRLERAPSVTSKTSKVSMASSNMSIGDPVKRARRTSQLEEAAARTNRQSGRTSSTTRPAYDYSYQQRRQSVDLSSFEDLDLNA
ncbi:hypothetical protein B0A52_05955 [Exophiala mesophila]|uniref:Uncharacterized protein n=1 Tax=Exophiala mesophila TaxID=212818 RepID=A0A438N424_EXOME|nr:hypothetical protein B0A52_05955 [Exophiala mesophila]